MLPPLLVAAAAAQLPAWWNLFPELPRLEASFLQESESAVFGKLRRKGRLQLAQGGKLRVAYEPGLLLVADGRRLVQYDPEARTAQAWDLEKASADLPLLNLLVDPRRLAGSYTPVPEGAAVLLRPKRPGLPQVRVEARGNLPSRILWTDGTGSQQEFLLVEPRVPASLPSSTFRFEAPAGTRWLGAKKP